MQPPAPPQANGLKIVLYVALGVFLGMSLFCGGFILLAGGYESMHPKASGPQPQSP
jgi:hypothetical protein